MFAFGETVQRLPKDLAGDRARLRKGKVLASKRSLYLQTTDSLVLPTITTTQLTQNCETACASWNETREEMNGKDGKAVNQIAKRGRLRDRTSMLEESGVSRVDELGGLVVSKLSFQNESPGEYKEVSPSGCVKKQRRQRSRLSKTDSGFCEDSGDDILACSDPGSPSDSDKASNISNGCLPMALEKAPKITLDFKAILKQDKTVIRNTEKLTARPNMCLQTTQSLHADLVAFKSLSTHYKGSISNCALQTNEHCVKLREVVLKTKSNPCDDGVKQSDTSLAVLKTRRRLLDKRNSCPPFPFTQRVRNKERVVDLSRATQYNCKHRVQLTDTELVDKRQCVNCSVDVSAHQGQVREKTAIDIPVGDLDCAVSTSGLTEKALLDVSQSQEIVDVNVKCQEWLNRWIAFNNAPQPARDNSKVTLESFPESS